MAEIAPNNTLAGQTAVSFTYDIRPQIGVGNSGVQVAEINAPAGYGNLTVTGVVRPAGRRSVRVARRPESASIAPAVVLNVMSVTLGAKVTTDGTHIRVFFDADTPASAREAAISPRRSTMVRCPR